MYASNYSFIATSSSSMTSTQHPRDSDAKPKLKIPMGTAVFAQNFPG